MSVARPCTCDRFHPGRPFHEGRDCPKCWMFAHRPEVRRAWGGNPKDCLSLYTASQKTPVEELVDLLDGPRVHLPEDWRHWPSMVEAHLILVERFLQKMPTYPAGNFSGRGAVICGGGPYEPGIYVACNMLRLVGWEYPIQVWHRGEAEPISDQIRKLEQVEVINTETHPARYERRTFGGWQAKSFALIHCPFEEILYFDADAYPVAALDDCFSERHNPHGIVTWPDTPWGDHTPQWHSYGLAPDGQLSLNGGHYILEKRKAWSVLQLVGHYDNYSDYYYCQHKQCKEDVGGYGDQDQMRAALHKLQFPIHRYTPRPLLCDGQSYIQAGPDGSPLFVHRFFNKFALPEEFHCPPNWHANTLPMEATAWSYFLEWMNKPILDENVYSEVPGWFTQEECDLWHRTCQGRKVLELGRHLGRSTCVAALSASKVVSIDRDSEYAAEMWLQRCGVRQKVWLRRGVFADLVPSSGGPFSACLVDGAHDEQNVQLDIDTILPHLEPGARIGFHDYADPAFPDVKPVVDISARKHGWRFIEQSGYLAIFEVSQTPINS